MQHLGDITKINGAEIEPVDVITGGSPCQDLSVAGKREGLKGARSGLFMEQIRIIKEMRAEDERNGRTSGLVRPRFMVWENVPGAFSSNKGEDFRAVLEEIARVKEPGTVIPEPQKGKWKNSGCVMGDGWSIAWRVLDAQFWGVPQRRRRIALVADFGGHAAPEILFVRESMCGNSAEVGETGKGTAEGVTGRAGETSSETIAAGMSGSNQPVAMRMQAFGKYEESEFASSIKARDYKDATDLVCDARGYGNGQSAPTLTGDNQNRISNYTVLAVHQNQTGEMHTGTVANTLSTNSNASGRNAPLVSVAKTLRAKGNLSNREDSDTLILNTLQNTKVRRLTPLECERLQGYPDDYTNIPGASDTARYRALGNSIALPPWKWVLKRISACYERDATLGSLFDGIGGFPLIWEQLNGRGSAVWASEIEPFCVRVTEERINGRKSKHE